MESRKEVMIDEDIKVSVLCAAYNHEKFIRKYKILSQTKFQEISTYKGEVFTMGTLMFLL